MTLRRILAAPAIVLVAGAAAPARADDLDIMTSRLYLTTGDVAKAGCAVQKL